MELWRKNETRFWPVQIRFTCASWANSLVFYVLGLQTTCLHCLYVCICFNSLCVFMFLFLCLIIKWLKRLSWCILNSCISAWAFLSSCILYSSISYSISLSSCILYGSISSFISLSLCTLYSSISTAFFGKGESYTLHASCSTCDSLRNRSRRCPPGTIRYLR